MSLKRKRSCDTLSASSTSSSPDSISPSTPILFHPHATFCQSTPTPEISRSNLHSRTRKRVRNNRPADAEVFGHATNPSPVAASILPPQFLAAPRATNSYTTAFRTPSLDPRLRRLRDGS
ncbi:MAG: hypothetical protein Q9203_006103 [Teloschistes exilis]